jgi:tungstate transport system substrate-binding protein
MMKKRILLCAVMLALLTPASFVFARGASQDASQPSQPVSIKGKIILATTTSTQDSGLLGFILPVFTRETGWEVDTISVGTGAALQMGRDGEADVLLVHSRADEIKFVADGHGVKRYDVMYNDFIVVGPSSPVAHNDNVQQTFKTIAERNLPFVSRGDKSGTHTMELNLWKAVGVDTQKLSKYTSAGQGMGATLQMANELQAYTLADRATWLKQRDKSSLAIVCEKGTELLNFYGVIAVNPSKNSRINAEGGQAFVDWMLRDSTQKLIGEYGVAEFGGPLFTPNASANK